MKDSPAKPAKSAEPVGNSVSNGVEVAAVEVASVVVVEIVSSVVVEICSSFALSEKEVSGVFVTAIYEALRLLSALSN